MGWKEKEYEFFFTASGTTSSLLFQSLTNGFYGPAIDNVSASAVPVPGPAGMLGVGLVGLVVAVRRKRR